jgi:hypothetical protein
MNERKKADIERIDALFKEIGAGDFTPIPLREAKELHAITPLRTRKELEVSETCKKVIYPSRTFAKQVARRRQRRGAGKLRIYKCEECHGFHLTSCI